MINKNILSILMLISMIVISYISYDSLPYWIATHFNIHGDADSYMPKKIAIFAMPIVYICTVIGFWGYTKISPKKFALENSFYAIKSYIFALGILFLSLHAATLLYPSSMGVNQMGLRLFAIGLGLFLMISGNVLGKTEVNFIIGFKLPWTFEPSNWTATHRFAGKLSILLGLLLIVITPFYINMEIITVILVLFAALPCIYSYLHFYRSAAQ